MEDRFSSLRCREVINICDGCRLGCVSDVVIDLKCGRVAALVVPCRAACSACSAAEMTMLSRGSRSAVSARTLF